MKLKIGVDLIEVNKFTPPLVSDSFLKQAFTQRELEESNGVPGRLAERFALKEAWMKALGQGIQQGLWFSQIEVWQDNYGIWEVKFSGNAASKTSQLQILNSSASAAFTHKIAIATVVLICQKKT